VLNLSLAGPADNFFVRKAVEYAVSKDVLVVAAAGNLQQQGKPGPPSYPAAYPGVLGVGSIDIEGARNSASQVGDFVDLVAPGTDVLGTTRAGGHTYFTGTSFAAPFVAGAAALVRSAWPQLTAPQVVQRLQATAAPARGGKGSPSYGAGLVDPYRAVTDGLTTASPAAAPKLVPSIPDPEQVRNTAWWRSAGGDARLWTVVAVGAGLLLVIVGVVVPRGRRRRWAPARADALAAEPVREQPPEEVFLLPPPPVER
jgi:subtilisin family serine protease